MHQLPWVFSAFHWERAKEREREKEKRGEKKKVRRDRIEGEPRRIEKEVTGEDMCAKEKGTERERGTTEIYRIQSTDVPESERASKEEKIVKTVFFPFITEK